MTYPVTPKDREAAADAWRDYVAKIGECIAERAIREGKMDECLLVQSYARHRCEALEEAAGKAEQEPAFRHGPAITRDAYRSDIATAIRALKEPKE